MTRFVVRLASVICALAAFALAAQEQRTPPVPADPTVQAKLLASVVSIRVNAVANARSNAELGRERAGSGVVADHRGHVLTSVFLVQEADSIAVTTSDGRTVPAAVVTEDHGTGIAILRPAAALGVPPMPLGSASDLKVDEPVLIVSVAGEKEIKLARVVAKREFAASWEYLVEGAILTVPAMGTWAGAALVEGTGRLVGIGSLLLSNALRDEARPTPGNLFIPVEAFSSVLDRVARDVQLPRRPSLGLMTEQVERHLVVVEVPDDTPASRAGIRPGDMIIAVNGEQVSSHAQFYRKLWSGRADKEIRLKVMRESQPREFVLKPADARDRLIQRAAL